VAVLFRFGDNAMTITATGRDRSAIVVVVVINGEVRIS